MIRKSKIILFVLTIALILSQVSAFAVDYTLEIAVNEVEETLKFSFDDLKAMPAEALIDEEYIYNSKTGEKTADVKGVSLKYLLKEKAEITFENGQVLFEASDGYPIDPQSLEDIFNDELKYVIAYEVNGEAIDNDENADTEDITIYRKVKEEGEFGTVYKLINKIIVTEEDASAAEETVEEESAEIEDPADTDVEKVFNDITEEYKFAEAAIYELANKGIIDGMGDGLYAPQNPFTREQFCKIIVEALGYETKEYQGAFSDVTADRWSSVYVQAAVDNGLFVGNTDGTFLPEKIISRQEMAAVAARAAVASGKVAQEKLDKFVMEKSGYSDKDTVADWAGSSVAWLEAEKVFEGVAVENFEPAKDVNRAEAALVVFNTLFK
ncbi:S-layer homology domain-containing protein [Sedimentibacter hydroxybenzoicus DSM 7310]|uniref:S-layer homology domain-containing protein n=1 Tax=Sedimentibacter hydroxybenzoicus DSM 7310 TaxID=1123245 RepID=A0A974BKN7_SEDHY|nr:S-layer homology domain-containing protein [Sedimentibacter hydroxybenzoicus]NYB74420.1 S-layer homology domain-containing protein [Sedimentibacter hydroxybenzoicus DSM 7310]